MSFHRLSLYFLYGITLLVTIYLVVNGWEYYSLPLHERARNEIHDSWKPSGAIGHGAGIIGSLLMVILLLYSLRKRWRPMQQGWGDIRYWLNYHIWMGVTGPILVLFHTSFKFGGIVSVSFWSMVAVALSGVVGRYIYVQIPRSLSGEELTAVELDELEAAQREQLSSEARGNLVALSILDSFIKNDLLSRGQLLNWLKRDLLSPFRFHALKKQLIADAGLSSHDARKLAKLTKRRSLLGRRIAFLGTARKLLHHWHVFHKPFAIIMLVIMIVHIVVTVSLGYKWIF